MDTDCHAECKGYDWFRHYSVLLKDKPEGPLTNHSKLKKKKKLIILPTPLRDILRLGRKVEKHTSQDHERKEEAKTYQRLNSRQMGPV